MRLLAPGPLVRVVLGTGYWVLGDWVLARRIAGSELADST